MKINILIFQPGNYFIFVLFFFLTRRLAISYIEVKKKKKKGFNWKRFQTKHGIEIHWDFSFFSSSSLFLALFLNPGSLVVNDSPQRLQFRLRADRNKLRHALR